jgi:hypothetical protein
VTTSPDRQAIADSYLRLYERQMAHYEKTQDVEWKGSFGVWALLAAAIYWAAQNAAKLPPAHVDRCLVSGGYVVAALHAVWLWLVHDSEAFDKRLWSRYRRAAREMLSTTGVRRDEIEPEIRGFWKWLVWFLRRLAWIALEAGVTLVMASVLASFLRQASP